MFPGLGTLVNIVTVLIGTVIGVLVGHRLTQRTRAVVTDGLGLVTLLIAALSAASITDATWSAAVGDSAPMLIVLGSLLLGGIIGSILRIEDRLEGFGSWLQNRMQARHGGREESADRQRFIEGFVSPARLPYAVKAGVAILTTALLGGYFLVPALRDRVSDRLGRLIGVRGGDRHDRRRVLGDVGRGR